MGYTPRVEWNISPSQIPAVEERLGKLEDNRVEAFMNILKAQCYDSFFLPYYTQIHRTAFFPLSPILS